MIAFVTALLFALVYLLTNEGYGRGDLGGYLIFSLFFAVIVGTLGRTFGSWAEGSWWRVSVAWLIGALAGVVFVFFFALLAQGTAGAMSLPVGPAWLMGGGFGVALAKQRLGATWGRDLGVVGALLLTGVLIFDPVWFFLTGAQRLEIQKFWRLDSDGPLLIVQRGSATAIAPDSRNGSYSPTLDLLTKAGVTGTLQHTGHGFFGSGPPAKILLVLNGPVTQRFELPQPNRAQAVYVQENDGFRIYPPSVRTRDDLLILEPGGSPGITHILVDSGNGRTETSMIMKSSSRTEGESR